MHCFVHHLLQAWVVQDPWISKPRMDCQRLSLACGTDLTTRWIACSIRPSWSLHSGFQKWSWVCYRSNSYHTSCAYSCRDWYRFHQPYKVPSRPALIALWWYRWPFLVRNVCFSRPFQPKTHTHPTQLTLFIDLGLIYSFGCTQANSPCRRGTHSKMRSRALTDHFELCPVVLVLLLWTVRVRLGIPSCTPCSIRWRSFQMDQLVFVSTQATFYKDQLFFRQKFAI